MIGVRMSLLRGICQIPAYIAIEKGFFKEEGINLIPDIQPTAWLVPKKLEAGEREFAIFPWTRVAAAEEQGIPLVLVAGSGFEEAAIVVRRGLKIRQVRSVSVPQRGGMKDLTAMGLLESLGWQDIEQIRQPSGDGSIIAFFGEGVDAASMIEPYATMLQEMGLGTVVRRTGDIWPGAPGCCLATTRELTERSPETVYGVVKAFARGGEYLKKNPDEAAGIARGYIGVHPRFIRAALRVNQPNLHGIRNDKPLEQILSLMQRLEYIRTIPTRYRVFDFLDRVSAELGI
jgi:NitT/TauT family transport system substrate-binding protein